MIKTTDTIRLAFTKLKTRKIRTAVTVTLASLLFGALVAASLIITGVFKSIDSFRQDGLTSRYIVSVNKAISNNSVQQTFRDPALISEAKKRYEKLVEQKTVEAKKLGLNYSQANDRPPYTRTSDGSSEMLSISDPNSIVRNLLMEKYSSEPAFDDSKLRALASQYSAVNLYDSEVYTIARGSSLSILKDGKEVFYDRADEMEANVHYMRPLIDGNQMEIAPTEIVKPFMLPQNAGWRPNDGSLPIVLPQNIVEQLLGLDKLSDKASASERLERLKTVRKGAAKLTFEACYRNNASINLIQTTIHLQKDIKAHASDKDYQKPSLVYALPDASLCQNPIIISDTRTASEKKRDANQAVFDEKFGASTDPTSYFVRFKVVGISPASLIANGPTTDRTVGQIHSLDEAISTLLKTNGVGQAIPRDLYDQLPDKTKYTDLFTYTPLYVFGNEDNKMRYVEFANANDAQRFIDEQSCTTQYDNTCKPAGRPYQAMLTFSNSAALDDMRSKAAQWFEYGLYGVIGLAAVVMWITISRTIVDGRRETAVFRAIGFKRIDIATIYLLYSALLSTFVAIFALVAGFVGAYLINREFSGELTAQAQSGFGGIDMSKQFSLLAIDETQLLTLLVACLTTGILSTVIPLIRNVRRNPIRDMREE